VHHLPVDHYSRLESPVHHLDARVKVLLTVFFIAAESSLGRFDIWGALTLGLLPLFLAGLSEVPWRYLGRRVILASPFMIFIVAFQPFTVPGAAVWRMPLLGWTVTGAGLLAAAVLLVKFSADILMTLVLVTTTPFEQLAWGLRWWRVPKLLIEVMLMMFRYTFVLFDELERMVRTARLRAVELAPVRARYRAYARILGVHLLRSLARAERVYAAMLLRGFRDGLARQRPGTLARMDVLAAVGLSAFIWGTFAWRIMTA